MYLTWIRPTSNTIHLWNYFWAIKPLYDLAKQNNKLDDTYIFIADLHWLIWNDNFKLKENILHQYAIYKAIWFKNIFLQSDILEVTQIERYLNSFINLWKLNRLHSIKEQLKDKNYWKLKLDLLTYPVLMAADILWLDTTYVFLWKDQKQHLEVTKEIAKKINRKLWIDLTIPEGVFFGWKDSKEVLWLDWKKMSKSYNNFIDPFSSNKSIIKQVNKIITDNVPLWIEKDFWNCNIMKILELFENSDLNSIMKEKYKNGSIWYGESKKVLYEQIFTHFDAIKEKQKEIISNWWDEMKKDLDLTWEKVRKIYKKNLNEIKNKIFS